MGDFEAYVVEQGAPASLVRRTRDDLPDGDVLVEVQFSSLNYKDALAVLGKKGVIRSYPMIPGIDLAGLVVESDSPDFSVGQEVFATGGGLGEVLPGGFSQLQRVPSSVLQLCAPGMSTKQHMVVGTAGFTAMLCIEALESHGLSPDSGPVLVTGAGGGVGGFAITLLSKLGYQVVALTGRPQLGEHLNSLGADEIVGRADFDQAGRPLQKERWAAVVDSVGGQILATALSQVKYGGGVAACGLAGGADLPATVLPFILRGVALLGIDSVYYPVEKRPAVWQRIASLLGDQGAESLTSEIALDEVPDAAATLMGGDLLGRRVVRVR